MKKIVLYTAGTLGDHLPFIVLGKALSDRGHVVRMAVNSAMVPYVEKAGLEAFALTDKERGPEEARENAWAWDHWNNPFSLRHPKAEKFDIEGFAAQVRELADLCAGSDLLVSTAIRHQGYLAHALSGIPWLTLSLNTSNFKDTRAVLVRNSRRDEEQEFVETFRSINRRTLLALGADGRVPPWRPGWLLARHVLIACSPVFAQPAYDSLQPHASIDMTGFFYYEDPDWKDWEPDGELGSFLDRRPLVLAFSSQPLENPGKILDMHVRAARRVGLPLLVQSGWAGFSEEIMEEQGGEDVMFAPFLPQDVLFARASASIQHGGIGSIARALRAGCPLLIEPFGNDQHDNAQRVFRIGAGGAVHPFETSADEIAGILEGKILREECRGRAEEAGAALREEDGPGEACRLIEVFMERVGRGEQRWPGGIPALSEPDRPPRAPLSLLSSSRGRKKEKGEPMEIPRLIHQTWKDGTLPPDLALWRETWKRHHPGWEYRLWTDEDNTAFIERHYPWFLPIFQDYPEAVMKADAIRYFLMYHYGGVYADLDYECLRPVGPLLEGKGVVMGLEPEGHGREHYPEGLPFEDFICNAFLASVPGHPFWEEVIRRLVESHRMPGALDATGPFLLSRAWEAFDDGGDVSIVSPELLNPVDNRAAWQEKSPAERDRIAATAYGIHHWVGNWWKPLVAKRERQAKVTLLLQGAAISESLLDIPAGREALGRSGRPPKVSCLMVTADRAEQARRAVHCFRRQCWMNRELVIVDDGKNGELEEWVLSLKDPSIVFHRLPGEGKTLGELRNIAAELATGEWVTQWDDDDLSDPMRLEIQMIAAAVTAAAGCFLERHTLWFPGSRRLATSVRRIWEWSFLCRREILPRYPHIRKGEDTPVIERIVAGGRIALLDLPDLYVYVFHGDNTFESGHWEEHWKSATEVFGGQLYDAMVRTIGDRLGLDLSLDSGKRAEWEEESDGLAVPEKESEVIPPPAAAAGGAVAAEVTGGKERVLILVPAKNAAGHLQGFRERIDTLTWPKKRLFFGFLESDSTDGTFEALERMLPGLRKEYGGAVLVKEDFGYRPSGPRWDPSEQRPRRSIMAKSRNRLLAAALGNEEWVLWVDSDVSGWPPDVIERLLASGKEIVVPNCLKEGTGETFDLNTFKLTTEGEKVDWSPHVIGGILQPPKGLGRLYLSDLRERDCVEVDGVGGTMLLVKADLHREGLVFPPFSYRLHIETEGLACMARDMGYRCWGLPNLEITHP